MSDPNNTGKYFIDYNGEVWNTNHYPHADKCEFDGGNVLLLGPLMNDEREVIDMYTAYDTMDDLLISIS